MSRKIEANNDSGKGRNPEEIGKKKKSRLQCLELF